MFNKITNITMVDLFYFISFILTLGFMYMGLVSS